MAGNFNQAHEASKADFWQIVQPYVEKLFNPCVIVSIEARQDILGKYLDRACGVDTFIIEPTKSKVHPVASRIQKNINYRSFTIRNRRDSGTTTEYFKLLNAATEGTLMPELTLQAYVKDKTLLSMGIAKTRDILSYIKSGKAKTKHTSSYEIGQAEFFTVYWRGFAKNYPLTVMTGDYNIIRYPKESHQQSLFD